MILLFVHVFIVSSLNATLFNCISDVLFSKWRRYVTFLNMYKLHREGS